MRFFCLRKNPERKECQSIFETITRSSIARFMAPIQFDISYSSCCFKLLVRFSHAFNLIGMANIRFFARNFGLSQNFRRAKNIRRFLGKIQIEQHTHQFRQKKNPYLLLQQQNTELFIFHNLLTLDRSFALCISFQWPPL